MCFNSFPLPGGSEARGRRSAHHQDGVLWERLFHSAVSRVRAAQLQDGQEVRAVPQPPTGPALPPVLPAQPQPQHGVLQVWDPPPANRHQVGLLWRQRYVCTYKRVRVRVCMCRDYVRTCNYVDYMWGGRWETRD